MFHSPEILAGGKLLDWSKPLSPPHLILVTFAAITVFGFMATCRRGRFNGPYFSGLFVLALVPLIGCALYAAYYYRAFIEDGWFHEPKYTLERIEAPTRAVMFGWWTTVVEVGVYTALYVANRKKRAAERHAGEERGEGEAKAMTP